MSTATVNVMYVNQPKAGKKQGNIKTDTGEYYGVSPAMLGLFSPGGKYEISYESRQFNGKTFHTVQTVNQVSAPPTPSTIPSQIGSKHGMDEATAERIFVQGLLQAFIKAGKIEPVPSGVITATNALRAVWAETFGKKTAVAKTTAGADMNDEIPF